VTVYKYLIVGAIISISVITILITLSISKGIITTQEYEIEVDPFKDPQNLFITARVMIQNTGSKPLTNVLVNFGDGQVQSLGTLTPGQKVILSPPENNSLHIVSVSADNVVSVTKEYRIPPKMVGMMGS
jgi:hypothetical protein